MRKLAVLIILILGCPWLCFSAAADDTLLLAYHIEIEKDGAPVVLQEHGIRFGIDNPHVIPMGRAGRGKCIFRLMSVDKVSGEMTVEFYSDKKSDLAATTPTYKLDVQFDIGNLGEVKSTLADLSVELAYSIVRP